MSDTQFQGFPDLNTPPVDRTGRWSLIWYRLITALWRRTGAGGSGSAVFSASSISPATDRGFLYVAGGDGPPTGTPLIYSGQSALYADYTNKKLYMFFYGDSAWTVLN